MGFDRASLLFLPSKSEVVKIAKNIFILFNLWFGCFVKLLFVKQKYLLQAFNNF